MIFWVGLLVATSLHAEELPAGKGREMVQAMCSGCHGVNRITQGLGYSKAHWLALMDTMIDLSADKTQQTLIADYLALNFPPNTLRAPTLVEGDSKITFKEWVVPTLGQRSRDPVEAPDGSIWWAGQWGNLVGRIDPETGIMQEYALPKSAMPHSVTPDRAGHIWYTGNKNGSVGRLDPNTGDIRVYPMPDAARDPHTGVFDEQGVFWFTLQQSNRIGRLEPDSGDIQLKTLPTPGSRPYGIKVAESGDLWVACNGSNCLIKVDAKTMDLQEIKLPHEDTKVRRLDIAADGKIWYVNSARGRLGSYNPATGAIREWPSPSGPSSHPYAIEELDGVVWYNESGMRPDALVRFDPVSEKFQSWAIPSGEFYAGILRHMRPTQDGDLLIHQSATNRIIKVVIED
ncbi:MAG: Vgb family protein [Marinicella sp.]